MGGRELLMTAGARLFAERGTAGVSLREITREAGQRNVMAVQYHFGDRAGLLRAIVEEHARAMARPLAKRLDELPEDASARAVVGAVVEVLVGRLEAEGGPDFLRVAAELVGRVGQVPSADDDPFFLLSEGYDGVLRTWAARLEPLMPVVVVDADLHQRFTALRLAYGELGRRAVTHGPGSGGPLFESHLADLMTAVVLAEPSARTVDLLRPRTR